MSLVQTTILDHLDFQLVGYETYNGRIIYVTENQIIVLNTSGLRQHTSTIKGSKVLNFIVGGNDIVALLYTDKKVQIRQIDRLGQVVMTIENIQIGSSSEYPILKLLKNELYLVYPTWIQIVYLKDGSRSKYTDLVNEPQFHKINNLVLLDLVDSLSIAVLQLKNRMTLAIIPCTITQLHIQALSQVICLCPQGEFMNPKTSYIAVLAEETNIKIFDLIELRQISEIQLPYSDAIIELETDRKCQYLVAHFMHKESGECITNMVFKINTAKYYKEDRQEECPFMLFRFQIRMHVYLSAVGYGEDQNGEWFGFYYFRSGQFNYLKKRVQKGFRMGEEQMQCLTDSTFWEDNREWREIIKTYLQIQEQSIRKSEETKLIQNMNYSAEQKQLQEYYKVAKDFDSIVNDFSQIISQKSRHKVLSQQEVEQEWENFLLSVAKERNFMRETMQMFKLDYKVVKETGKEKNFIGIQLENCMKDIQGREGRVDARIKEKKKELERERMKEKEERERRVRDREEKEKVKERPKLTEEDIQKQEDEYNRFVAEYMAQMERKQAEEETKKKQKPQKKQKEELNSQFKLEMPKLNEKQRKLIQHKSLDLSRVSIESHEQKEQKNDKLDAAWDKFALILEQVEHEVSPLQLRLQGLIDKIDKIEHSSLEAIKKNQQKLEEQMKIDLQTQVRACCKGLFSKMTQQVKTKMDESITKLYKVESQAIKQTEQSISKFKQFARMQVKHRVEIYHQSRKRLELITQQYTQEKQQHPSIKSI